MPVLRNRLILDITRNLRAFLTLHAGLVRSPVPETRAGGPEREESELAGVEELERARNQNRRIEGLREELSRERQRVAELLSDADEETAHGYVSESYGYEYGLPEVGLLEVLPNLDETVRTSGFPKVRALPADVALLKGLARKTPDCDYLEIGSWREESMAGVAEVARECVSINPTDEELRELGEFGSSDSLLAERAFYRDDVIARTSHAFVYAGLKNRFDLAFVDANRPRESVRLATENAFDLLKSVGSTIVWRGYRSEPGKIDWQALAGILDGCPEDELANLYHVSGTSCAVRLNGDFPRSRAGVSSNEVFDVRLTVRKAPRKLVVLDDAFPNLQSSFRIAEYNAYLERWKDATVYSTASNPVSLREKKSFSQILGEYASLYPRFENRVFRYGGKLSLSGDLAYFIFLNNVARFLGVINDHNARFAFTLYPGGGFQIDQEASDQNLRRAFSSPNFEKVIATQKLTRDYLIEREFCDPDRIEFVYGGVFPLAQLASLAPAKSYYKEDKDTFDVCFVAYKYVTRSIISKGYDVFVEVAKQLARTHDDIYFHVVGTFDESDIDVSELGDRIRFHGPQTSGFFPSFYSRMDIILSPNVPFALFPGAFDGFPTGGCMEAGLCGVAVLCTDPLDLNVAFEDGEEIVIVPHDAEAISATIDRFHERYEDLRQLAKKGQEAFTRVFGTEAQMGPRLRMLSELLGED